MFQMNGRTTGFRPQTRKYYRTRLLQKNWLSRRRLGNDKAPFCRLLVDTSRHNITVFFWLVVFVFFFRKISKHFFSKAKGNAFAFVHQHGRRYVNWKPVIQALSNRYMHVFSQLIYLFFKLNCTCISVVCEENVFWFIFIRTVAWPSCEHYNSE